MKHQQQQPATSVNAINLPWYRQFWPWFIIALPMTAVIASFITLWLAISHPDHLVVEEDEYQQLHSDLKAQNSTQSTTEDINAEPDTPPDQVDD